MRKNLWSGVLLVAMVAAISLAAEATGGVRTSLADSVQVQITQTCSGGAYGGCTYAFSPSQVTVPAGSTITWVNGTSAPHTASADAGAFDTGTISASGQASVKLTSAGTYSYHCNIHPYMMGSITVTGAASATSIPPTTAPSSTSVPPTAGPLSTSTSVPPTATATLQPSPTDTVTAQPALSVSASLAPKNVHPGGKLKLSIRTGPRAGLDMTITRPGTHSVHHHARAKNNGTYQTTITIGKSARHGTLTVKITAKLGSKTAHAVTRSSIR
jgi:plastocyanin